MQASNKPSYKRKTLPKRWYYQQLAMAKNKLGLDEETYRDLLKNYGAKLKDGRISATTMSIKQLQAVYGRLCDLGYRVYRTYKPNPPVQSPSPLPVGRQAKVIALANSLGVNNAYINSIACRMYGVIDWQDLDDMHLAGIITALRKQAEKKI